MAVDKRKGDFWIKIRETSRQNGVRNHFTEYLTTLQYIRVVAGVPPPLRSKCNTINSGKN